jgi:hypothetical protein
MVSLDGLMHVKVKGKTISMSQNTLFTRLAAIAQRQDEDIERYFAYEMTLMIQRWTNAKARQTRSPKNRNARKPSFQQGKIYEVSCVHN